MPNIHERHARLVKATAIAKAIREAHARVGTTLPVAELARLMSPETRRIAEEAAEVREASEETWRQVIDLLEPSRVAS